MDGWICLVLGGNILCLGHAATLDTLSRQLLGGSPRTAHELSRVIMKVPYLSTCILEEQKPPPDSDAESSWKFKDLPYPPVTNSSNMRYDWKILMS